MTKREYLYTVLSEEAAEVAQAAAKILRFGETTYNPADEQKKTNEMALVEEYTHLQAVILMLSKEGYLPTLDDEEWRIKCGSKKMNKVKYYMNQYLNFANTQEGIAP